MGLGGFSAKKIAGEVSNGYALNTQIDVPIISHQSTELENNVLVDSANASAGRVVLVRGKKLNLIDVTWEAHPTYFIPKVVNDWIGGTAGYLDTHLNTSQWDLNVYEPVLGNRRYTNGKCVSMAIIYNANGGPILVRQQWVAIYGGEKGSPATFTAPTRVTGQGYDTASFATSSVDLVRSFVHAFGRMQKPQNYGDNTYYAAAITTHSLTGTMTLEQGPTSSQGNQIAAAENTVTGTLAYQIGPATTGVKITTYVNRNSKRQNHEGSNDSTLFFDYDLGDVNNVSTTGYPLIIVAGV
jgi:hypothetical protein